MTLPYEMNLQNTWKFIRIKYYSFTLLDQKFISFRNHWDYSWLSMSIVVNHTSYSNSNSITWNVTWNYTHFPFMKHVITYFGFLPPATTAIRLLRYNSSATETLPTCTTVSIYLLWQPNNTNVTKKPPLPATLCLPEEFVS